MKQRPRRAIRRDIERLNIAQDEWQWRMPGVRSSGWKWAPVDECPNVYALHYDLSFTSVASINATEMFRKRPETIGRLVRIKQAQALESLAACLLDHAVDIRVALRRGKL